MRKAAPAVPKPIAPLPQPSFSPYFIIAAVLTFLVPILVLPYILDNAFNTPKTVLMQLGVCLMTAVYSIQLFRGKEVSMTRSIVPKLMLLVILLNFFSFFYTRNYYYTNVAVTMHVTALLFMLFVSLHISGKTAFWLLVLTALSGILVSLETWSMTLKRRSRGWMETSSRGTRNPSLGGSTTSIWRFLTTEACWPRWSSSFFSWRS